MSRASIVLSLVTALVPGLAAQTFDDLSLVRDRPSPYASLLQIKAGMIGSRASPEVPAVGLEDEIGWDGHVYYRAISGGSGTGLEAYAGRDGALLGLRDGNMLAGENTSRLELKTRYFPFYREGYYEGSRFTPTGRYEGKDYEAYLGFGRPADEALLFELGGFWRRNTFDRNQDTAASYVIPDDYNAYGLRLFAEHDTLVMDRNRGVPREGFLLTALAEREWNDSDRVFGFTGFQSELPSAVWRGRGHLEWYFPGSDAATWVVWLDGALLDKTDRVQSYDAQRPLGNLWGDGQLRLRWFLGDSIVLTPFAQVQFSRLRGPEFTTNDKKWFFGGGLEADVLFGESVSLNFWYSFLDNESRPPVSVSRDLHGEHMFFAGMVLRFGAARR